jgi:hypothetical protein
MGLYQLPVVGRVLASVVHHTCLVLTSRLLVADACMNAATSKACSTGLCYALWQAQGMAINALAL